MVWAAVLLWPGEAPAPLLFLLVVVIAVNGPGTGIGFDFPARTCPRPGWARPTAS
ncbi:hypothetical protein G7085_08905 [Tessaracoccus sp. HDW20]|nr:hypothetical protein [Tessaracoccus coleopterorum]